MPSLAPLRTRPRARPGHLLSLMGVAALCAGCATPPRAVDALPDVTSARTVALAEARDLMNAPTLAAPLPVVTPDPIPVLTGRGFSQVAGQPGKTVNERRLLAMRAARLEALRDLTEQVHGIRISADSTLRDAVMRDDRLAAHVEGTLRGARTVSIEPKGDDGYSVVMDLDADTVAYILRALRSGA